MVYIDLDGVMADFDSWAREHLAGDDQQAYMEMFVEHYKDCFKSLEPIQEGLALLSSMDRKEACILTAMPNHTEFLETGTMLGYSISELERRYDVMRNNKLSWVMKYIGDIPVLIVPSRKDKVRYARGNILVDDYIKNIDDWNSNGGRGILFTV